MVGVGSDNIDFDDGLVENVNDKTESMSKGHFSEDVGSRGLFIREGVLSPSGQIPVGYSLGLLEIEIYWSDEVGVTKGHVPDLSG